jgi:hypothetical protein
MSLDQRHVYSFHIFHFLATLKITTPDLPMDLTLCLCGEIRSTHVKRWQATIHLYGYRLGATDQNFLLQV